MTANEQRYKEALEKIIEESTSSWIKSIANAALNPPPEYEEVEVVRWIITSSSLHMFHKYEDAVDFCNRTATKKSDIVELKGTYKRPVKPKVKRRELIGKHISHVTVPVMTTPHSAPKNYTVELYAEWEERDDI